MPSTILTAGNKSSTSPAHLVVRHDTKNITPVMAVERLEVSPPPKGKGGHIVVRFQFLENGSREWAYAEFYTRDAAAAAYIAIEAQPYEEIKASLKTFSEGHVGFLRIEKCEEGETPWFYSLVFEGL